jgi:putative hydrolase of the HAD superfamily
MENPIEDILRRGPNMSRLMFESFSNQYRIKLSTGPSYPTLDVVKQLTRHPHLDLYLATGQEHYRAAYLWNELELGRHFKDMFYSAKLGCSKSSTNVFDAINHRLGITPDERPLFFDDQEEIVRVACASGWDAWVFNTVKDVRQHSRLRGLVQ